MLSGFNDNALYSKKDNQSFKDIQLPTNLEADKSLDSIPFDGSFFPRYWDR